MIIEETLSGGTLLRRTSDQPDKYLHKVGTDEIYAEAIDLVTASFTYEEVDAPTEDEDYEISDSEALKIITTGSTL